MKSILQQLVQFEENNKNNIGYAYAIFGNISMSIMQVCAKQMSLYLVTSQFLMYRAFCLAIVNTIVITLSGHNPYVKKTKGNIVFTKMFISAFAVYLQFLPLKYMPLSILNSIRMTGPIFTHFLQACIMGTKINKKDLLTTCLSFFGIILMVQPQFLFGKSMKLDIPTVYVLMALLGTLLISIQSILVRKIKDDITNDVLVEYFYISQIYINSMMLLIFQMKSHQTLPWVPNCFVIFGFLVVSGYIGQILNTRSLFMMPASKAMPFRYINVIIGFLIDIFFYSLSFDWISVTGIVLTSISLAYMTLKGSSKN